MNRSIKILLIIVFLVPIVLQVFLAIAAGGIWLVLLPFNFDPISVEGRVSVGIGALIAISAAIAGTAWVVRKTWPSS